VNAVRESNFLSDGALPLIVKSPSEAIDLVQWAGDHHDEIRKQLLRRGGILFRGFQVPEVDTFHQFMVAVSGHPLRYVERSSPRHEVEGHVYTSTDYPADQSIFLHNEQSYNNNWPLRIFFHCIVPPSAGGGTPLADCRRIYRRLSAETRQRLEERGYAYVRNFGSGFGLSWRQAFQTDDRSAVEEYCRHNDIDFTWRPGERLTTRQIRTVSARHPESGEWTWFNHLTFFNVSTLEPALAKSLLSMGIDRLPNNTYYGDGEEIEPEVLNELRAAYHAETVVVPWQKGDILMLDNMITAHGREPFTPPREIVVGMTEPWSRSDG
jgi:alpha-ketoglutarate-dependent taurine dioxygenase